MRVRILSPLLLVLAVLFVAAPASAGDGTNLVQYVPDSSFVVLNVNVDGLRSTSAYTQFMSLVSASSDYEDMMTQMGTANFNPQTDIHTVMVAMTGTDDDDAVVFIEGTFNRSAIEAVIAAEEGTTTVPVGTDPVTNYYTQGDASAAFLTDGIVVFGQTESVQAALSVVTGSPAGVGAGSSLRGQVSAVDTSQEVWMAGTLSSRLQERADMQGVSAFRGAFDVGAGLGVALTLVADNADLATAKAAEFNAQMQAINGSQEVQALGLGSVLSSVSATASGNDITISLTVDQTTWGTLMTTLSAIVEEELH